MSTPSLEYGMARLRGAASSRRRQLGLIGVAAVVWLAVLMVLAVIGPLVAPADPNVGTLSESLQGPSFQHLLGTDISGRDILSRLIHGVRPSLLGPVIVVAIALGVGVPLALTAAWTGGRIDMIIGRLLDLQFAFPAVLIAILAVALYGPGLAPAVIALGVAYIPFAARITRSVALRERRQLYVAALEVQGCSAWAINLRHILPNLSRLIVAQATIAIAYAIVDLAALSFLGLGTQPPTADWGVMVNDGDAIARGAYGQAIATAVVIVASVVALTVVGDRLSEGDGT
ncbi:ABC transporter permease [Nitriliruptor alkaliphilus]|uniref:ABC transporter permease n=1 Tax=Nitriliruptor alkaliphilus TaxID=427918 RepID=UPI001B8045E3|nr:ABC transporter permease [Nitriliruptor alkaliphilus]